MAFISFLKELSSCKQGRDVEQVEEKELDQTKVTKAMRDLIQTQQAEREAQRLRSGLPPHPLRSQVRDKVRFHPTHDVASRNVQPILDSLNSESSYNKDT